MIIFKYHYNIYFSVTVISFILAFRCEYEFVNSNIIEYVASGGNSASLTLTGTPFLIFTIISSLNFNSLSLKYVLPLIEKFH